MFLTTNLLTNIDSGLKTSEDLNAVLRCVVTCLVGLFRIVLNLCCVVFCRDLSC